MSQVRQLLATLFFISFLTSGCDPLSTKKIDALESQSAALKKDLESLRAQFEALSVRDKQFLDSMSKFSDTLSKNFYSVKTDYDMRFKKVEDRVEKLELDNANPKRRK